MDVSAWFHHAVRRFRMLVLFCAVTALLRLQVFATLLWSIVGSISVVYYQTCVFLCLHAHEGILLADALFMLSMIVFEHELTHLSAHVCS